MSFIGGICDILIAQRSLLESLEVSKTGQILQNAENDSETAILEKKKAARAESKRAAQSTSAKNFTEELKILKKPSFFDSIQNHCGDMAGTEVQETRVKSADKTW